jgi:hypothetical protein
MNVDHIQLKGRVHMTLYAADGSIKQECIKDNLVVTTGKAYVASALIAAPANAMTRVAIGTSNSATAVGQTDLQGTELARVVATTSNPTSVTALLSASFGAGVGTGTIEEAGIFNATAAGPASGTMFSRYLTGTFTKGATDTLVISWTLTVT